MAQRRVASWDIFCAVVDNFGDIGVCWRLARQLATEHGAEVRLWLDDLRTLARIWPGVDPAAAIQRCDGIEIRAWSSPDCTEGVIPADVVVEAFACRIPDAFERAMAARTPQPAWLNLEYLSAEAWVETHHLLPSPHPRLPLVKRFFFPGFTPRTGGLLREAGLLAERDRFQADPQAQSDFWRRVNLDPPVPDAADGELRISLFAYPNPAAPALFDAWSTGSRPVLCIVPEAVLESEVRAWLECAGGPRDIGAWHQFRGERRGNLRFARIPFLRQTEYDRLLWACDVNFVRGEDSFVRAQWAGRPMVWQIYPQAEDAHRIKLGAFLGRYAPTLPHPARAAVGRLFDAWNGTGDAGGAWSSALDHNEAWGRGARAWADGLAGQADLAWQLREAARGFDEEPARDGADQAQDSPTGLGTLENRPHSKL